MDIRGIFWDQKPGVWRPKFGDMSRQQIEMTHNSNMNALTKRVMDTWKKWKQTFFQQSEHFSLVEWMGMHGLISKIIHMALWHWMYPLDKWIMCCIFIRAWPHVLRYFWPLKPSQSHRMLTRDSPSCLFAAETLLKTKRKTHLRKLFDKDHFKIFISRTIIVTCQVTYIQFLILVACQVPSGRANFSDNLTELGTANPENRNILVVHKMWQLQDAPTVPGVGKKEHLILTDAGCVFSTRNHPV